MAGSTALIKVALALHSPGLVMLLSVLSLCAGRSSKAALNIITKSMSIDLEPLGVTCVLLHPGWVQTRMTNNSGLIDTTTCVSGLLKV